MHFLERPIGAFETTITLALVYLRVGHFLHTCSRRVLYHCNTRIPWLAQEREVISGHPLSKAEFDPMIATKLRA